MRDKEAGQDTATEELMAARLSLGAAAKREAELRAEIERLRAACEEGAAAALAIRQELFRVAETPFKYVEINKLDDLAARLRSAAKVTP